MAGGGGGDILWAVGFLAGLAILATLVARRLGKRDGGQDAGDRGGRELEGATLLFNEEILTCDSPVRIAGKPDQVWRLRNGRIVVVDTKTRPAPGVFESDRVQLSAYALIVARKLGRRAPRKGDYGFIRFQPAEGAPARFVKVDLHDQREIVRRYRRAQAILADGARARPNPSPGLCRHCGHRARCDAAAG